MFSIYNDSFYKSGALKQYAQELLGKLPEKTDLLLSSGASGCAIASAMLVLSDRPLHHVCVRKATDSSHSTQYAGGYCVPMEGKNAVVVDDIISTGETVKHILAFAKSEAIRVIKVLVVQDYYSRDTGKLPKSWNVEYLERIGGRDID